MSSCCETPESTSSKKDSSSQASREPAITTWIDTSAPLLSALLHSSCCWLPTLLDLTSIGSASAATVSSLRPLFLAITVLVLLDSIRRQGLTRHNILRIFVSVLVLAFPRVLDTYRQTVAVEAPKKHSCH